MHVQKLGISEKAYSALPKIRMIGSMFNQSINQSIILCAFYWTVTQTLNDTAYNYDRLSSSRTLV